MKEIETRTIEESLGTLIDYRGKTPPKTESGIRLVTAKVIKDGYVQDDKKEFIAADFYDEWMRRGLPKQWDIVITTEAPLGEVAQLRTAEKVALAQRVILLRTNPDVYVQSFFFQALKGHFVQGALKARGTGTTVLGIKQSELRKVRIPWFPLPTQRKIASILSAYDDLIENNTRRIAILEEMAQAIYREWFVNFRFPGHENVKLVDSPLGQIPEGWEVLPFTDIADILSGGTPKTTNSEYWNGDVPFFTPRDCPDGFFVLSTARSVTEKGVENCSSANFPERSIFITARGTVGKTILTPCNMAMSQSCYAVKPKALPPEFIFLMLRSSVEELKTMTHGAVFDTIIKDTFNEIQIALSQDEVALSFVESVKPMFDAILNLYKKNQLLRTTRDLLLPKLISGKLDVEDLDIDLGITTEELEETTA